MKCPFFLVFKRIPFDSTNPIGYFVAVTFQYIALGFQYFVAACTLSLGMGEGWFTISATKEIQHILHSIDEKAQINKNRPNELNILFTEFIHLHKVVKQLS